MGDKVRAKAEMRAAGVPLVPGHGRASRRSPRSRRRGRRARLPGAAEGDGGRRREGHAARRLGRTSSRTRSARRAPRRRRRSATARSTSRRRVVPARHVEIQVLCDADGGVLTLGERECSIQRRHQKLVEESPSPALDAGDARGDGGGRRARVPRRSATANAGTFEFLLGPDGAFYFIEVNCRLQVEHPVTELVTGIDIVREQLRIAAGEPLAADRPRAAARPRDRDPDQRRGSRARLRARARDDRRASGRRSGRACASTPHVERGRDDPAVLRLADREGDRLGRRPRRGDRPRRARARASSRSRASRRRASSRSTSSLARSSRAATTRPSSSPSWRAACRRSPGRMTAATSRKAARRHGALPPLPVGSHRPAARLAVRGRARRLRTSSSPRRSPGARRRSTSGSPRRRRRLARRPARYARAQHPAHRRLRARGGDGAARGGDQRGGRAGEALRDGGRGAARQRHPRPRRARGGGCMTPVDDALGRARRSCSSG